MEPILGNLNTKTLPCLTEWPFELSSQHDVGAVKTSCSTLPRSRPCAPKWHSGRRADMALRSAARDLVFNKLMECDKIWQNINNVQHTWSRNDQILHFLARTRQNKTKPCRLYRTSARAVFSQASHQWHWLDEHVLQCVPIMHYPSVKPMHVHHISTLVDGARSSIVTNPNGH